MLNFEYLLFGHYIHASKNVMIRGNVSKPKGVHEQKRLGITGLEL
jgi:hypothetical protein